MWLLGALRGGDAHGPATPTSLLDHFAALEDPRQRAKVLYPLPEILLLLLCASLAGADDLAEVELRGGEHLAFLRRFLPCRHGIPSHRRPGALRANRRAGPSGGVRSPMDRRARTGHCRRSNLREG